MLSYSALLNHFMRNTVPIYSGLLFFTKHSQNYHTVFTQGVYYIGNETRGEQPMSAEEYIPESRITITDETLKNEIIEYALRKIGTTSIGLLDGMTLVYQDRWYDITVENGNVTVDEV